MGTLIAVIAVSLLMRRTFRLWKVALLYSLPSLLGDVSRDTADGVYCLLLPLVTHLAVGIYVTIVAVRNSECRWREVVPKAVDKGGVLHS